MTESGGPTTQSGISYQNLYAASRLAEMLSGQEDVDHLRSISVRIEAPTAVDDVVVTYADGHHEFVQAKESLQTSGDAWRKVWMQFKDAFNKPTFLRDQDWLVLCIGNGSNTFGHLQEMFESMEGSNNFGEWHKRLSNSKDLMSLWIEKLKPLFPDALVSDLWLFLRRVRVEVRLRSILNKEALRLLPAAFDQQGPIRPTSLFSYIESYLPKDARRRVELTPEILIQRLQEDHQVRLAAPPTREQLLQAVQRCSASLRGQRYCFGTTGKVEQRHIPRTVTGEILRWLLPEESGQINPSLLTSFDNVAVLLDGPGRGKTVVLRDVLHALESPERNVVTLAIKADRQLEDLAVGRPIHECERVQLPALVEDVVTWLSRSEIASGKPVVVLLDQVDALSLSMARDSNAIEGVANLVDRLRGLPGVRVLLACRTFDLNTTPALRDLDIKQRFSLDELSDAEVKQILDDVGIETQHLATPTLGLLKTPLHLDLFLLAVERQDNASVSVPAPGDARAVRSLQDLYGLLWERFILTSAAPVSSLDRLQVIRLLVEAMESKSRTNAPQSLFQRPETAHLQQSLLYLESSGLLQREKAGTLWSFLHQTFFDYAYARFFVEDGKSLSERVLRSPQGLIERPLLLHVLGFLRATEPPAYEHELQELGIDLFFDHPDLKKHLRRLLQEWFGALREPTETEWRFARRLLLHPERRHQFLHEARRNSDWFSLIVVEHIPRWLEQLNRANFDARLEGSLFWFLESVCDEPLPQSQVMTLLRPYISRSDDWNRRLEFLMNYVRKWHSEEATRLYEELLLLFWERDDGLFRYHLREIAKQRPIDGCRILHHILAFMLSKLTQARNLGDPQLIWNEFTELQNGGIKIPSEAVDALAENTPSQYIDAVWEFFVAILTFESAPSAPTDALNFPSDAFQDTWNIRTTRGVYMRDHFGYALSLSLGKAFQKLSVDAPDAFKSWIPRLAELPYETPQTFLLDTFAREPERYSAQSLNFLTGDHRRLELGEEQFEARHLLRAVAPFWSPSQCYHMEQAILCHWRLPYELQFGLRNTWLLKRRGIEQWRLLLALGKGRLTIEGKRRLREWNDKFYDLHLTDQPITGESGVVGPPIDIAVARRLSDNNWLTAMAHYYNGVKHRQFLKGGAEQLCHVLEGLVREQPERFAHLFLERVPLSVDAFYVKAALKGLADSVAPDDLLFDVIRRFLQHTGPDVYGDLPRHIAQTLEKRAENGLPDDLFQLMASWVKGTPPTREDESHYSRQLESKGEVQ